MSLSCQEKKKVDSGSIENNIYVNEETGWKITIPDGWKIMTTDQRNQMNEKGKRAIEDAMGAQVDVEGLRNLIGFQKDIKNIFNSTLEPFVEDYEGEWEENNELIKEILLETYSQNGISAKVSDTKKEKIGGVDFLCFSIIVNLPDNSTFTQIMYSAFINGYSLGININYTDKKHGEEMINAFKNSTFESV